MSTLLLRLAAPLQSWGENSKFEKVRRTNYEPTKSGVVGMIAAAFGRSRADSVQDLNLLRFGVRVDQQGQLIRDYQIVQTERHTYVTDRYYMEDAVFIAGLESQSREELEKIQNALLNPVFPLFLGRRSCPVTLPLCIGISENNLEDALKDAKWCASDWWKSRLLQTDKQIFLRVVTECIQGDYSPVMQHDVALSFNPVHREYGYRGVATRQIAIPSTPLTATQHDPMQEL